MTEIKWTIRPLNSTTYLIRENDDYGEYPHIYARPILKSSQKDSDDESPAESSYKSVDFAAILLIDTGSGTAAKARHSKAGLLSRLWQSKLPATPARSQGLQDDMMTLHSFLSTWPVPELNNQPLNPNGSIPYLISISHCHYDHIMGLTYFPTEKSSSSSSSQTFCDNSQLSIVTTLPKITVLASSYDRSFIVPPYPNLNEHSLCKIMGLKLPDYAISYWAEDGMEIEWPPPTDVQRSQQGQSSDPGVAQARFLSARHRSHGTGIFTYQTPGHTPDSLTVYDSKVRHLFIGDTIYERESPDTVAAGEPPMPIMFDTGSSLAEWFKSVRGLISLVTKLNNERSGDMETLAVESNGKLTVGKSHMHLDPTSLPRLHPEFMWIKVRRDSDGSFVEIQDPETTHDIQDVTFMSIRTEDFQSAPHHSLTGSTERKKTCEDEEEWSNLVLLRKRKHLARVQAGAAHVTAETDAEDLLRSAMLFVQMVVDDKIPGHRIKYRYSKEEVWEWSYTDPDTGKTWGRYSVSAPLRVVEEERQRRSQATKASFPDMMPHRGRN